MTSKISKQSPIKPVQSSKVFKPRLFNKDRLLLGLIIIQMLFIFTMSSFGPDSSNAQSGHIVQVLTQILPNTKTHDLVFIVRKAAHFFEYALLGILFYLRFSRTKKLNHFSSLTTSTQQNLIQAPIYSKFSTPILLSVFASFIYACTDEVHQLFVPGRSGQFFDVCVDTLGAFAGCLLILSLSYIRKVWQVHHRSE